MYYLCTSEEEKALNTGVFSSFFGENREKTIVLQSIQKILYAEEKFLPAFADFFRAKLVRELTMQSNEKLKDIYFQTCIFFISGNVKVPHVACGRVTQRKGGFTFIGSH